MIDQQMSPEARKVLDAAIQASVALRALDDIQPWDDGRDDKGLFANAVEQASGVFGMECDKLWQATEEYQALLEADTAGVTEEHRAAMDREIVRCAKAACAAAEHDAAMEREYALGLEAENAALKTQLAVLRMRIWNDATAIPREIRSAWVRDAERAGDRRSARYLRDAYDDDDWEARVKARRLTAAMRDTLAYVVRHGPVDSAFLSVRKRTALFRRGMIVETERGWIATPEGEEVNSREMSPTMDITGDMRANLVECQIIPEEGVTS